MHLSTTRTFAFVLFPLVLVLALAAFFVWRFGTVEREQQTWVVHTYEVIGAARVVVGDLAAAEAAQRTYILTGAVKHLAVYRALVPSIRSDVEALRRLTADNPPQQNRIGRLQSTIDERLATLEAGLAAYASGGFPAAQTVIRSGRGDTLMQTARSLIAEVLQQEDALLRERRTAAAETQQNLSIAAVAVAGLLLLLVIVVAYLLQRGIANLRATEAQRSLQAHLVQTTLNSIRDGVAAFDAQGKLIAFNPLFFELSDFPGALAVAGTPLARLHEIDSGREHPVLGDILRPLDEKEGLHAAVQYKGRHLECYRNRIPGGGMLVNCVDVTARVQGETILRQSQKMEAIGQLTGGVAHDFNNLLQIVATNLELLSENARGDSKAAARLQNAMFGVERAARLTRQLLAFARRQPLEPRSIDVSSAIRNMAEMLQRALGEAVEVETVVGGGLWNVLIDPNQFENAVLNLAINARDAMPDGGKLTIELANAFLDERYARENVDATPGQYVMLAVTDTGQGMTPEVMARVFDPFFTTKKEGQGTGLGLSQVYGFVKQSGGHIKFYSEVGHGTTAKIYLPRTRKPQEAYTPAEMQPLEGGSETILVVEDDDGVRASVVDMLMGLGYRVFKASRAEEALAVLGKEGGIDVLFTDVVMPGPIATRDFVQRAQQMQPGIAVLYTSGYTHNAIVHHGRLDEGVSLISKPYRKEELARKLRSVISGTKATPPAAPAPDAPKAKVLVVEDDTMIRLGIVDMVTELGHEVAQASRADKALEILTADPAIGILLCDIGLPDRRGDELAAEAQSLRPSLKVILCSGYSSHISGANPSGGITHLAKPFDLDQLRSALEGPPVPRASGR